jgi:hypothetical protein
VPIPAYGTVVGLTQTGGAARLKLGSVPGAMATIDEDLNQLEKDIRQLKIEYEQYFGGGRNRPPADLEWRIELVIKRYGERGSNMRFAHRYRYASLAQTHARYKEVFRKRLKQKEEGVVVRHFGAAAKAIEAERAKHKEPEPQPEELPLVSAAAKRAAARRSSEVPLTPPDSTKRSANSSQLYEAFRSAKQRTGESVNDLTPEAFQKFLKRKAQEILGESGGKKVIFAVSTEDGKVKLKARVSAPVKSKS